MRKCPNGDHYEYIATYVNNLAIIMKDPQAFIDQLEAALYNFKLKGSGTLNFHLGCFDFTEIALTPYVWILESILIERKKPTSNILESSQSRSTDLLYRKVTTLKWILHRSSMKMGKRYTNPLLDVVSGIYLSEDSIHSQP